MHARALTLAALCALAAALALPASGAAGTPPTVQTVHFTSGPYTTSVCGIDNVVETDQEDGVFKTDANGQMSGGGLGLEETITNPATGKTVRYQQTGMGTAPSAPEGYPNGDGTYTIHFLLSGMFKYSSLPGGPFLSGSGHIGLDVVLDSSFNVISIRTHSGGSTPSNNTDNCPLIAAALT